MKVTLLRTSYIYAIAYGCRIDLLIIVRGSQLAFVVVEKCLTKSDPNEGVDN